MENSDRQGSRMGRSARSRARGFTLIELLAGMAVLSILIVLLAQFVNLGTDAWDHGMRQAESSSSARAALEFLASELSTAIAGDRVTFSHLANHTQTYFAGGDHGSDALMFVSVSRPPDDDNPARAGVEVVYFLDKMRKAGSSGGTEEMPDRYRLVRSTLTSNAGSFRAYQVADWTSELDPADHSPNADTIAENISAFQVRAYRDVNSPMPIDFGAPGAGAPGAWEKEKLPVYVDIYLETLSDTDAQRAALIRDADKREEYVKKWSRGYGTRVHFKNRQGYSSRDG